MWNFYSWPLDATTGGVDLPVDLPIWALTVEMWNCYSWTNRCHYWGSKSVDLPVDLPIWALTVEMWNCYSWQLNATTGGVDLPLDLPICALTAEMWNCHSWPLDATTGGVDLPPCLPKLPVSPSVKWQIFYHLVIRVERWNCHSDALADPPEGRSATFGVVVFQGSMVNWEGVDLPLDLPVHITWFSVVVFKGSMVNWGVDLPLDLPIWALTVEMWNCHSWPLDALLGG